MRLISFAAFVLGAAACIGSAGGLEPRAAPPVTAKAATVPHATARDDSFEVRIRPLLARTCAPCHNPGGKLYAKLPFDRPDVIRAHRDGVLRRLKGADLETVRAWLGAAKP